MGVGNRKIKRGPGKQWVDGKSFRVADEVRYIQKKAANHDSVLSASVNWSYFLRMPAMLGCST
jgi:hypothetical protein